MVFCNKYVYIKIRNKTMETLLLILNLIGIISTIFVISVKNPVHSVFFLILTFCVSSCILLTLIVDFLAIIFIVVYVGAIAVLFLFVVMMLNIKFIEFTESILRYIPFSIIIGSIFISEIIFLNTISFIENKEQFEWITYFFNSDTILLLSEILYTVYIYNFFLAGIVLLIAMIGTINITLYHALNVKRQLLYKQLGRSIQDTIVKKF